VRHRPDEDALRGVDDAATLDPSAGAPGAVAATFAWGDEGQRSPGAVATWDTPWDTKRVPPGHSVLWELWGVLSVLVERHEHFRGTLVMPSAPRG